MDERLAVYCTADLPPEPPPEGSTVAPPVSSDKKGVGWVAPFDTNKLDPSLAYREWPCLLAPSQPRLPSAQLSGLPKTNDVVVCEIRVLARGGFTHAMGRVTEEALVASTLPLTLVVFATTDGGAPQDPLTVRVDDWNYGPYPMRDRNGQIVAGADDIPAEAKEATITVCTPKTVLGDAACFSWTVSREGTARDFESLLRSISVSFSGSGDSGRVPLRLSRGTVQSEDQQWDGGKDHALRLSELHLVVKDERERTGADKRKDDRFDARYDTVRVAHVVTAAVPSPDEKKAMVRVLQSHHTKEKLQLDPTYETEGLDRGVPRVLLLPVWRASQLQGVLPQQVMATSGALCREPEEPSNPSNSALKLLELGSHGPEAAAAVGFFTDQVTQLANGGVSRPVHQARVRARMAGLFLETIVGGSKGGSKNNNSATLLSGDPRFAVSMAGELAAHAVEQLSCLALRRPTADTIGSKWTISVLALLSKALQKMGGHPETVRLASYPSLQLHQLVRLSTHRGAAVRALREAYARCSLLLAPLSGDPSPELDTRREQRLLDCVFRANPVALIEARVLTRSGGAPSASFDPSVLEIVDVPIRPFFSTDRAHLEALQVALLGSWRARCVKGAQWADADAEDDTGYTGGPQGGTPPYKSTTKLSVLGVRRTSAPAPGGGGGGGGSRGPLWPQSKLPTKPSGSSRPPKAAAPSGFSGVSGPRTQRQAPYAWRPIDDRPPAPPAKPPPAGPPLPPQPSPSPFFFQRDSPGTTKPATDPPTKLERPDWDKLDTTEAWKFVQNALLLMYGKDLVNIETVLNKYNGSLAAGSLANTNPAQVLSEWLSNTVEDRKTQTGEAHSSAMKYLFDEGDSVASKNSPVNPAGTPFFSRVTATPAWSANPSIAEMLYKLLERLKAVTEPTSLNGMLAPSSIDAQDLKTRYNTLMKAAEDAFSLGFDDRSGKMLRRGENKRRKKEVGALVEAMHATMKELFDHYVFPNYKDDVERARLRVLEVREGEATLKEAPLLEDDLPEPEPEPEPKPKPSKLQRGLGSTTTYSLIELTLDDDGTRGGGRGGTAGWGSDTEDDEESSEPSSPKTAIRDEDLAEAQERWAENVRRAKEQAQNKLNEIRSADTSTLPDGDTNEADALGIVDALSKKQQTLEATKEYNAKLVGLHRSLVELRSSQNDLYIKTLAEINPYIKATSGSDALQKIMDEFDAEAQACLKKADAIQSEVGKLLQYYLLDQHVDADGRTTVEQTWYRGLFTRNKPPFHNYYWNVDNELVNNTPLSEDNRWSMRVTVDELPAEVVELVMEMKRELGHAKRRGDEEIGRLKKSERTKEGAGFNAGWFTDTVRSVEGLDTPLFNRQESDPDRVKEGEQPVLDGERGLDLLQRVLKARNEEAAAEAAEAAARARALSGNKKLALNDPGAADERNYREAAEAELNKNTRKNKGEPSPAEEEERKRRVDAAVDALSRAEAARVQRRQEARARLRKAIDQQLELQREEKERLRRAAQEAVEQQKRLREDEAKRRAAEREDRERKDAERAAQLAQQQAELQRIAEENERAQERLRIARYRDAVGRKMLMEINNYRVAVIALRTIVKKREAIVEGVDANNELTPVPPRPLKEAHDIRHPGNKNAGSLFADVQKLAVLHSLNDASNPLYEQLPETIREVGVFASQEDLQIASEGRSGFKYAPQEVQSEGFTGPADQQAELEGLDAEHRDYIKRADVVNEEYAKRKEERERADAAVAMDELKDKLSSAMDERERSQTEEDDAIRSELTRWSSLRLRDLNLSFRKIMADPTRQDYDAWRDQTFSDLKRLGALAAVAKRAEEAGAFARQARTRVESVKTSMDARASILSALDSVQKVTGDIDDFADPESKVRSIEGEAALINADYDNIEMLVPIRASETATGVPLGAEKLLELPEAEFVQSLIAKAEQPPPHSFQLFAAYESSLDRRPPITSLPDKVQRRVKWSKMYWRLVTSLSGSGRFAKDPYKTTKANQATEMSKFFATMVKLAYKGDSEESEFTRREEGIDGLQQLVDEYNPSWEWYKQHHVVSTGISRKVAKVTDSGSELFFLAQTWYTGEKLRVDLAAQIVSAIKVQNPTVDKYKTLVEQLKQKIDILHDRAKEGLMRRVDDYTKINRFEAQSVEPVMSAPELLTEDWYTKQQRIVVEFIKRSENWPAEAANTMRVLAGESGVRPAGDQYAEADATLWESAYAAVTNAEIAFAADLEIWKQSKPPRRPFDPDFMKGSLAMSWVEQTLRCMRSYLCSVKRPVYETPEIVSSRLKKLDGDAGELERSAHIGPSLPVTRDYVATSKKLAELSGASSTSGFFVHYAQVLETEAEPYRWKQSMQIRLEQFRLRLVLDVDKSASFTTAQADRIKAAETWNARVARLTNSVERYNAHADRYIEAFRDRDLVRTVVGLQATLTGFEPWTSSAYFERLNSASERWDPTPDNRKRLERDGLPEGETPDARTTRELRWAREFSSVGLPLNARLKEVAMTTRPTDTDRESGLPYLANYNRLISKKRPVVDTTPAPPPTETDSLTALVMSNWLVNKGTRGVRRLASALTGGATDSSFDRFDYVRRYGVLDAADLLDVGTAWDGDHDWPLYVHRATRGPPDDSDSEAESEPTAVVPPIPYPLHSKKRSAIRCLRFVCPYGLMRACATEVDERGVTEAPVWLDVALSALETVGPVALEDPLSLSRVVVNQATPSDRLMRGHEYRAPPVTVTASGNTSRVRGPMKQRGLGGTDPRVLEMIHPVAGDGGVEVAVTSAPLGPLGFQRVVNQELQNKAANKESFDNERYLSALAPDEPATGRVPWSWADVDVHREWRRKFDADRFGAMLDMAASGPQMGNAIGVSADLEQARCVAHLAERMVQAALLIAAHQWDSASRIVVQLSDYQRGFASKNSERTPGMSVAEGDFMDERHSVETTARLACAAALAESALGAHLPLYTAGFVLPAKGDDSEHDEAVQRVVSRFKERLRRLARGASACTLGEASLAAAAVLAQERDR